MSLGNRISLSFRQYSARVRKRSRFVYPLDTSISNRSFWLMFSASALDCRLSSYGLLKLLMISGF